jgi:tetratricopeptide (TPR) repeat protein
MMPEEKALSIYFELARWHIEKNFDDKKIQELKQYMDDIPAWIRYQTLIMGHSLLAMYSFTSGHIEKSYDYFRKAIEISNIAGYTIYEAKLLYSLSKILVSIGEAERARECTTLIESLTERSNIQLGSL